MSDELPVAVVQRPIAVLAGADEDELERRVLTELFPAAQTGPVDDPDVNVLLRGGPDDGYVWHSRLAYDIHQTPLPGWLTNRVATQDEAVGDRLAGLASVGPADVSYDVAAWRRRLGKD